jgi:sigma-B regulation protein RsbU (phosphoserine phosphatase)
MRAKLAALNPLLPFAAAWVFAFALVFVCLNRYARNTALRSARESARLQARGGADRIETFLRPVEELAQGLAAVLEEAPPGREGLLSLLRGAAERSPQVSGVGAAFEPGGSMPFAQRWRRAGSELKLEAAPKDYAALDWYQVPRELGKPLWSEPYAGGAGFPRVTYSAPFFRGKGKERRVAGVVAVDVPLETVAAAVRSIQVLKTGRAFLLSQDGAFLADGSGRFGPDETLFSLAEERGDATLRRLGRRMLKGEDGLVEARGFPGKRRCSLAFAPVPSAGWSLAVSAPRREALADARRMSLLVVFLGAAGLVLLLAVAAAERK